METATQTSTQDARPLASPTAAASGDQGALEAECRSLGAKLETRTSITWLAAAAIMCFVTLIAFGVSYRMLAESARLPHVFWLTSLMVLAGVPGFAWALLVARRLHRRERDDFARYCELRGKLGLG